MSSSHLGRNPFSQKSKPHTQEKESDTPEKAKQSSRHAKSTQKNDIFEKKSLASQDLSWAERLLIDLPARSLVFAIKTALLIKDKLR